MKSFAIGAVIASAFASFALADITSTDAYAYATPKSGKAGAAYINIQGGEAPDRLLSAASDIAQRVEIHEHQLTDGVMRMREVEAGIELPAEGHIEMAPGDYHIMLMGLNEQLLAGDSFPVTLMFDSGTAMTVEVVVKNRGDAAHSGHSGHAPKTE